MFGFVIVEYGCISGGILTFGIWSVLLTRCAKFVSHIFTNDGRKMLDMYVVKLNVITEYVVSFFLSCENETFASTSKTIAKH